MTELRTTRTDELTYGLPVAVNLCIASLSGVKVSACDGATEAASAVITVDEDDKDCG